MNTFRDYIKPYKDFPKEGVVYWDFSYLLKNPDARSLAINAFVNHFKTASITKIAAIESKGFTIGSLIAEKLNVPLVLIRKPGLIPGAVYHESFVKEYGTAAYELKQDSCDAGDTVLIIYDIMAGSGATEAAIRLVQTSGAGVAGCGFVVELEYLHGRDNLSGYDLFSLVRVADKPIL